MTTSGTISDIEDEDTDTATKFVDITEKTFKFVTRKEWRAAKSVKLKKVKRPATNIVIHYRWGEHKCYDQESCKDLLQDEQRRLMRECGEDDIPFHFLIGDDGTIYEGRGWDFISSKKLEFPLYFPDGYDRIDFAYIGNYENGNRFELAQPMFTLVNHGMLMKYVSQHWALYEEPILEFLPGFFSEGKDRPLCNICQ